MPNKGPRLNHTKSRKGCSRCKARKVKCDESKPFCKNCLRHDLHCQYPAIPEASRHGDSSSRTVQFDPQIEDIMEPDERRILELQLMHHFVSVVSFTFPSSDLRSRDLWTIFAMNLAFNQPVLINAMFAVTTLHLLNGASIPTRFFAADADQAAIVRLKSVRTKLNCKVPLGILHSLYLSLAIKQQRDAVASSKTGDAELINAVFLSTVLISYQALSVASRGANDTYVAPTQWLRMVHGITSAARMVNAIPESPSIPKFLGLNPVHFLSEQGGPPNFRDDAVIFHASNREPFQRLLDFVKYPEPVGSEEGCVDVYEKALSYVGGFHRGMVDGESPRALFRRVLCFGIKVPTLFTTFVEQRRPRAIVILAHHCALAVCVNDHWIFHGFAEREVEGLGALLPDEWQWAMEWPKALIVSLKALNSFS